MKRFVAEAKCDRERLKGCDCVAQYVRNASLMSVEAEEEEGGGGDMTLRVVEQHLITGRFAKSWTEETHGNEHDEDTD